MRDATPGIRKLGAEPIAIGNGSVRQARAFLESFEGADALPFPLFTDPSLETYRRARLPSGVARTFGPLSLLPSLAAMRQGFRQTKTQGAPFQQGGAFVIAPGNRVTFEFRSHRAGDHPDFTQILSSLP